MAAFRLALTHNYDTTPASSMWYAHNYAQRRTHARNFSRNHYTHDYSHNVNHEYSHAAPSAVYTHNPYHICQERTIEPAAVHAHTSHATTHGEYSRPYRDYLTDYSHNAVLTHPHGLGQGRTHTPTSGQRTTHNASHGLAHTSNQRCGHNEGQTATHLGDIEVNPFTHNTGHAYSHECQYALEQPTRTRHNTPEQGTQVHAYTRDQGASRARHHPQDPNRRLRTRSHDIYPFYPEFIQSSEEEESTLEDDIRVDLPYTHLHCRGRSNSGREEYSHGRTEHIIRRFEDPPDPCAVDDSTVGLSYQQRADVCITQGHPTTAILGGGSEVGDGLSDGRTGLLIGEGLVREWVRAVGVVAASGTLVTLVLLGFGVYNMLITTLFLLFVLTTVALLIFLLMRRPPCCPCCQDPYDTAASTNGDSSSQTAHIPYLTETHGIVVKKWMKDSPPPYESPPDYSSLSPELIMDAKSLQELVHTSQSQNIPVGVHTSAITTSASPSCQGRSSSPLCTTPLFSTSFCDNPRSLTPTVISEGKVRAVYESPPSPIFSTHHYPTPTSSYVPSPSLTNSLASATVPSAVYGQTGTPPPAYETLRLYTHEGSRRKDNH